MGGGGQAKPKTRPAADAPQGAPPGAQPLKFVALVAATALYLLPILSGHAPPGAQDGLADRLMVEAPFALAAGVTGAVLGLLIAWGLQASLERRFSAAAQAGETRERRIAGLESELAAAVAARRAATAATEASERARATLRAALDHELRAPLQGLTRLAVRLSEETPAPRRRAARVLAGAGATLSATLDDLAGVAGAAAGPTDPVAHGLDLGELVEDVCALFWDQAEARGLDLAVYVDPATPRLVPPDPIRLRRIVGALVEHGLRTTEAGGVLVEIEPDAPGSVRISVRDTGPGIPRDRVDEALAAPGLAAAQRLAEAMGSRLQVAGEPGRGSAIALRLAAPADAAVAPAWPQAPMAGALAVIAYEGVATRRALGRYLARAGYGLSAPDGGAEPALVLGDLDATPPGPGVRAPLPQPFRRIDIETLLARVAAGEAAPASDSTPPRTARNLGSPDTPALLDALEEAIDGDRLTLVYQPQFDREAKAILGVETLVRWIDPQRGPMDPSVFIPLAEAHGRIRRLTNWVVEHALTETADLAGLQVAFNASAIEFAEPDMVERMQRLVARTGFDPYRLEVEITETAILENEDQVRENMSALRAMGMKMALDDFGAGYSSLGHLRRYPFDKLKIDRAFIVDCTRDAQSATVVHAVVSIGRALGMKVVAEGVETEQQRQFLKIAGVHAMQGFLFGRPAPIEVLRRTLETIPAAVRARA